MNLIVIFCWYFCTSVAVSAADHDYIPSDWIDPTDMRNYDRYSKSMRTPRVDPAATQTERESRGEVRKFEVFLERFINRFLYSADLKVI